MLGGNTLYALATMGVYVILGARGETGKVGLYWWAYALSIQTVTLVASQLEPVLFASLSRLQGDSARHGSAFLRSLRGLAVVVVPLSVLQAVVAEPAVKLVFAERWHPAIPLLELLSIGMVFAGISVPSASMMQSQGRFRSYFVAATVNVGAFGALLAVAAHDGRVWAFALAALVYYFVAFVVNLFTALGSAHLERWRVVGPVAAILGAGALAGGVGFAAQRALNGTDPLHLLARCGVGAAAFGTVYLAAVVLVQPAAVRELISLIRASIARTSAHRAV
jgi:PST family polysaccharide transporter